jgi:hypothetical protein
LPPPHSPPLKSSGPAPSPRAAKPNWKPRSPSARLNTSYWIEYGPTSAYGSRTSPRTIQSGPARVVVKETLRGLSPGSTYHYKFVAENSKGPGEGADQTFQTFAAAAAESCPNAAIRVLQGSTFLPECRAYEQVSPVEKNGGNVNLVLPVQAGPSGDGVTFQSAESFAGNPTDVKGNLFLSSRSADGWSTAGIDPPQFNQLAFGVLGVSAATSEDLSKTEQVSLVALAPGAVEGNSNLYLRDNQTGRLTTIATEPGEELYKTFRYNGSGSAYSGSTSDFSHILFASPLPLTAGATAGIENVFDYTEGHLVLVSEMPGGGEFPEGATTPGNSTLHATYPVRAISADGSRIFFQSRINGSETGGVFMREDGRTIPISVSQRSGSEGELAGANFLGANADGSVVFFDSKVNLTDASDTHGSPSLYRYEVDSGRLTDLTVNPDPTAPGGGGFVTMFGVSEDGSYAYFTANGALVEGTTEGSIAPVGPNLYAWHEGPGPAGTIKYIGHLGPLAENELPVGLDVYISPDGHDFAFGTTVPLTETDVPSTHCAQNPEGRCAEVYDYDYASAQLTCVSCDGPSAGDAELGGPEGRTGHAVLNDGTVFFSTPSRLRSQDTNGQRDVYAWKGGAVSLISTGTSEQESNFADATADGSNVFFRTSQQLVSQDTDQNVDLYVDRREGGIAAQNAPPPPPPCQGEACRGPASARPSIGSPGTAGVVVPDSSHAQRQCSNWTNGATQADKRAMKLEKQSKKASGKQKHKLRQKAKHERKKSKQLKAKARNCGGQAR